MRLVTRLVSTAVAALVLSSLAGCATQTTVGGTLRGDDTAVRAEARRISNTGPLGERGIQESAHARGAASF